MIFKMTNIVAIFSRNKCTNNKCRCEESIVLILQKKSVKHNPYNHQNYES